MGVEWIEADRLREIQLAPASLVPMLEAFLADRTVVRPIYLGDVGPSA